MSSLTKVWEEVRIMLTDGLSLIPVRDKPQGEMLPKTPYAKWREFQSKKMTESELWQMMEEKKTEAVALICGKVSGNLELIDIDSKYYDGISIKLFKEIKSLRPDLYDKLRVHKTPSGGYHILYRIADGEPQGNQKLSERLRTPEEIQQDIDNGIKKPKKYIAFLETRGEGGYALMPPSLDYSVHINNPIPLISWSDRCELIQICRSFNENIPKTPSFKRTKIENNAYDLTPWEDYNDNSDIVSLLSEYGWKVHRHETAERYYFTRPGKDKGVSASLTKSSRKFYVFTSSTELENEKTYSPCDLLVTLRFNGDRKQAYKWMVENGFGRVKSRVEQSIVKQRAFSGSTIPQNFSDQAKTEFEQLKSSIKENMPYGIFWEQDTEKPNKYNISREDLYRVSDQLGFKIFNDAVLVRIDGSVIMNQTESEYFDALKNYIWEEEADVYTAICNSLEAFFQRSGKYSISRLRPLDSSLIMSDSQLKCYKFYQNGFIEITSKTIVFKPYSEITGLVWDHKVHQRNWVQDGSLKLGVYPQFLENAIGITPYLKRVIGYLSHDHKSESSGYIIVLIEKVPNPKDGGGSGKNIFGNILRNIITIKTVPGSQVKFDENFLQPWNQQRIYFLADLPKRIDWPFLKEMATGTGIHKRLYKDQVDVASEDMPKLLVNTNYSYEDEDGGLIRRIRHVEFTPYYTLHGGVDEVHGKMFPSDFNNDDWTGFDHFIAHSIQELFKANGKIEQTELSEDGWSKKFQMTYGEHTYQFISDNINHWQNHGFISNKLFNEQYQNFSSDLDIPSKYKLSAQRMNAAILDYCKKNKINFEPNKKKKINSLETRGKQFGDNDMTIENEEFPF